MTNLSRRLAAASEKSAQASRRITEAEGKIARTLLNVLRERESRPQGEQSERAKTSGSAEQPPTK